MTVAQLRHYLEVRKNAGSIITEHQQKHALTKKSRLKLINLLADLIKEDYDDNATEFEIKSICLATVTIFPSLADETGGIGLLYGSGYGFLYEKLRYNSKKGDNNQNAIDNAMEIESGNSPLEQDQDEVLQYLKNCVVHQNKEELKQVLASCVEFRRKILSDPPQPIYKMFGFYFVDPELILFDFEILYSDIDGNAFMNTWPEIKHTARDVHDIHVPENIIPMNNPEILDFLHLLKFIPSRAKFENVIKEFIIFGKTQHDDPVRMVQPRNPHPIIIVIYGLIPAPDTKFYIGWQDRIFSHFEITRLMNCESLLTK
ncbi:uncharacterized protein LOC129571306 [Sitodiplosis mosellana]|uniref:uncharacterized protein LOC129571306 n=1 Tax=Sitodiplosis mosellana TaxID=263140 RepID=UPI002443FD4C|nr:uncharacterized protein LOC129571306 [Sitodiplosis mosellana]